MQCGVPRQHRGSMSDNDGVSIASVSRFRACSYCTGASLLSINNGTISQAFDDDAHVKLEAKAFTFIVHSYNMHS